MRTFSPQTFHWIKAKSASVVKEANARLALSFLVLGLFSFASPLGAASPSRNLAAPGSGPENSEDLPDIQTRDFNAKVIRRSSATGTDNRMYLLEDDAKERPRVGRILLFKLGEEPVMAFRVLKSYPGKKQFAARQVRKYGAHETLEPGTSYQVLERISQNATELSFKDHKDIKDLENIETPDETLPEPEAPPVEAPPIESPPAEEAAAPLEDPAALPAPPAAEASAEASSEATAAPQLDAAAAPPLAPADAGAQVAEAAPVDPAAPADAAAPAKDSAELDDLEKTLNTAETPPETAPDAATPDATASGDATAEPAPETPPADTTAEAPQTTATDEELAATNLDSPEQKPADPPEEPAPATNEAKPQTLAEAEKEPEDADREPALTYEEDTPLDRHFHAFSAEFGMFRNRGVDLTTSEILANAYYGGAGVRYAFTLNKMMFMMSPKVQDTLTLEGSLFMYKIINFSGTNDTYTVTPLVATLRYNMLLNDSFGFFLYGGFVRNQVLSNTSGTDEGIGLLNNFQPAGGAGMIFQVGPNWHVRVDTGIDMIGAGLMLRF